MNRLDLVDATFDLGPGWHKYLTVTIVATSVAKFELENLHRLLHIRNDLTSVSRGLCMPK